MGGQLPGMSVKFEPLAQGKKFAPVLAGGPGFEPRLTGSEPVVLPLNYPPSGCRRCNEFYVAARIDLCKALL